MTTLHRGLWLLAAASAAPVAEEYLNRLAKLGARRVSRASQLLITAAAVPAGL